MKVTIEKPSDCTDFENSATLKIEAFEPRDIFRLGCILMECLARVGPDVAVVHSETNDLHGMFLRFPLVRRPWPRPIIKQVEVEDLKKEVASFVNAFRHFQGGPLDYSRTLSALVDHLENTLLK